MQYTVNIDLLPHKFSILVFQKVFLSQSGALSAVDSRDKRGPSTSLLKALIILCSHQEYGERTFDDI